MRPFQLKQCFDSSDIGIRMKCIEERVNICPSVLKSEVKTRTFSSGNSNV